MSHTLPTQRPAAPKPVAPRARAPVVAPAEVAAPAPADGVLALLQFEAEIRQQTTVPELRFHLANEVRRLLPFRQAFVVEVPRAAPPRVSAVSSLATVEAESAVVQWALETVKGLHRDVGLPRVVRLDGQAYASTGANANANASANAAQPQVQDEPYAFQDVLWLPLRDRQGEVFAGVLMAAAQPWRQADEVIAERLGETYAHAWLALAPRGGARQWWTPDTRWWWAAAVLPLLVLGLPVRLSALAPVEVVAAKPVVLAAPIQGVIDKVHVPPNTPVQAGQKLLSFEDTRLRNELALAEQRLAVAQARSLRANQAAFGSAEASHEVAINKAELDLAQAEYQYARDVLARAQLTAPQAGVLIYSDPRDLEGRPVEVGQQLLQIADPQHLEFRIELPARDNLVIREGAQVTVYLDSAPLHPLQARLVRSSYQARPSAERVLSFVLTAVPEASAPDATGAPVAWRIGSRGTAQVYGERVPLLYKIVRRPLAALRQWAGV